VSNQAWWRVVIVFSSLTVCGAAVACCYLLRVQPTKYESMTVKQDGFLGRFNKETGQFERGSLPPATAPAVHDWSGFPVIKPASTSTGRDANGKYAYEYGPVINPTATGWMRYAKPVSSGTMPWDGDPIVKPAPK
jgi:hypothetical protein